MSSWVQIFDDDLGMQMKCYEQQPMRSHDQRAERGRRKRTSSHDGPVSISSMSHPREFFSRGVIFDTDKNNHIHLRNHDVQPPVENFRFCYAEDATCRRS